MELVTTFGCESLVWPVPGGLTYPKGACCHDCCRTDLHVGMD